MSMDPVVLGLLGDKCQQQLQMFELVNVYNLEWTQCYMCIARHALFFVTKWMDKLCPGQEQISYMSIEKAVADTDTRRLFALKLAQPEGSWQTKLLIESHHRDVLLERIALCWQAEYMYARFEVEKFPQAKGEISKQLPGFGEGSNNIDLMQVKPFREYAQDFKHRGYSFFLRKDFHSSSGLKQGSFVHDTGWEVRYSHQNFVVPAGVMITLHVQDPIPIMELERSSTGADDLRTVAAEYKRAITDSVDQFYVWQNGAYIKKMNRTNDIASWDGWEFFVRSKDFVFVCVLLRREHIPPLCDIVQDIAVVLRCPAQTLRAEHCEVLLDECRFVADSVSSTSESKLTYNSIIQSRLDALQFNEESYRWLEGYLKLSPVHKRPAALKFVKSIVKILITDFQFWDETLIEDEVFREIPYLHNPLHVAQEMLSDASALLDDGSDDEKTAMRRHAFHWRISRYLAYCVDGGVVGDRFSLGKLVQIVGKSSLETNKTMRSVVEFLLFVVPRRDEWKRPFSSSRMPLSQLLQNPSDFENYMFNESVMRVLLIENYISEEWKRKQTTGVDTASYERLLAAMLTNDKVGVGLRTLICRQILDTTPPANAKEGEDDVKMQVLVKALVKVMEGGNLSLSACATAALVNRCSNNINTKTLLVASNVIHIAIQQLQAKDDDLTLYTLYLLVNLTKTPQHRAIVVRECGVPIIVDILTSSYQNLRKHKILAEVAGVLGQLCNDKETRLMISEDFPVVLCLLWVFDSSQQNTKLKSSVLFSLRQLCALSQNKIKVGSHVIPTVIDQLSQATPKYEECATNAILLLSMVAGIHTNALMMAEHDRLEIALEACGIQKGIGPQARHHKFSAGLWTKVLVLKDRIMDAVLANAA
eukprot:TRINITY_DN9990_c0_g1_i1.p1 TRINITY_DN9990_c0_g1~~TRINITY_DN9990_c0_g1_i1.p1  ORF type:complete len:874 (-),score=155.69 TRINITY_DN9990_c0_g1_i1:21-2642(-)